jgi:drug/metabolite transporter (DMT)-like permease
MNRPLLLLLGTGTMLGLNFPIGKLALSHGVNPALWAAIISLGAGISMLLIAQLRITKKSNSDGMVKFAIVSGCLSYVIPNLLTFMVIPKIGSGLAAVMFALSPVATALISIFLRVRPPNLWGIFGIALGLVGALIITLGRNSNLETNGSSWIIIALLIPIFLGLGNVYRTLAWPEGASPHGLAANTNLAAVPFLLLIFIFTGFDLAPLASLGGLVALQILVSTIMFLMFFQLQKVGGPTYLSQIGYVAAAVGLLIGATILGEIYPTLVWVGAGVVALGIAVSTWSGLKKT